MELQLQLSGNWPVGRGHCPPRGLAGDDLETVVTRLQEAEINAWAITTPPALISAGIHDPAGGPDIGADFHHVAGEWPCGAITAWLLETASLLYPVRLD